MFKRALAILFSVTVTACLAWNCSTVFAQAQNATRAREVKSSTAAEVTVTLNEQFFNSLLEAIFTRLKSPRYPLSLASVSKQEGQESTVSLKMPSFSLAHAGLKADACESV